jgi:ABC-2 type transport system permease protein
MRFVWVSTVKDLRRLRREPLGVAAAVGMPLVITLLVTLIFGGGPKPQARLLVADEDDTALSTLLRGALGGGPMGRLVLVEAVSWADGRRRLDRGDGSALLLIPKGFERAVLRDKPCRLKLLTNPSQRILPAIIQEGLSVLVEGGQYVQLLFGDQLRAFSHGLPADGTVARTSVALARLGRKMGAYLAPPRIRLENAPADPNEPDTSRLGEYFFPGMLFLAVLLVGQGRSADFWKERAFGTLRRTGLTPSRLEAFLAGKLLAAALVCAAVAALGLASARWLLHVPVANPLTAVLWVAAAGVGLYLAQLLLNLFATTERAGNVQTTLAIFLFGMVGGTYFPFEMMPGWLAAVGRWTPNGWAIVRLKAIVDGSVRPTELVIAFAGIAALSGLAFVAAAHRLRRTLAA